MLPSWLPKALRGEGSPLWAIVIGGILALGLSVPLSVLVASVMPALKGPEIALEGTELMVAVVLFAPLVETLIMAAVLALLLLVTGPRVAILVSALGWAAAHSLQAAAWGLVIWWPFLIFSTLYVAWRKRGLLWSLAVPAGAHAVNNFVPALMIAVAS